jgi:hypothetical protein
VQDQATDEIESLNRNASYIDRVTATDPLPVADCEAVLKHLFIHPSLNLSASRLEASSARSLLHAARPTNQTHPSIRAINARLNGRVQKLAVRGARQ